MTPETVGVSDLNTPLTTAQRQEALTRLLVEVTERVRAEDAVRPLSKAVTA